MSLSTLLIAPKYVENLGICIRTGALAGVSPFYVSDDEGLLADQLKRGRVRQWSSQTLERIDVLGVHDARNFLSSNRAGYRRVATVIDERAKPLYDFEFSDNDLLVFGDEHAGLDDVLLSLCDERVTIPQAKLPPARGRNRGGGKCFNLLTAYGMFVYEHQRQEYLAALTQEQPKLL